MLVMKIVNGKLKNHYIRFRYRKYDMIKINLTIESDDYVKENEFKAIES